MHTESVKASMSSSCWDLVQRLPHCRATRVTTLLRAVSSGRSERSARRDQVSGYHRTKVSARRHFSSIPLHSRGAALLLPCRQRILRSWAYSNSGGTGSQFSSPSSTRALSNALSSATTAHRRVEESRMTLGPALTTPLSLQDGVITTATGVPVLELPHGSIITQRQDEEGALLLGVSAQHSSTSMLDVELGRVNFWRFMACARCKLWWMTPEWGASMDSLPPETQFLLVELREGGPYAVLLPLLDKGFRGTLRPTRGKGKASHLTLRVESGAREVKGQQWDRILYMRAGQDPYELIERGVAMAARLSGGALPRTEKSLPPSLDVFGWCTWDAFYSTVSARGLQQGLASLVAGGAPPKFLIIDDGWQLTDVDEPFRKAPTSVFADKITLKHEGADQNQIITTANEVLATTKGLLTTTEEDFFKASGSVLAPAARVIQSGTSAGNVMPTLAGVGPSPHHTTHPHVQEDARASADIDSSKFLQNPIVKEDAIFLVRAAQQLAGWVMGLGTAAFLIFYQWVIEPAAHDSLAVKSFARAAQTFLKPSMLSFYASASDFTRRLTSVRANGKFSSPEAGPDADWEIMEERLGDVVRVIKRRYGVQYIYCWHGLPGYWSGVMPDAPGVAHFKAHIEYAEPTPGLLEIEPSMAWNPAVLAGVGIVDEPQKLYRSMHGYLSSCGIDGVKVDCQAGVGLVGSATGGGPSAARSYHEALEESIRHHFPGNHCINCMCHSTENLYQMTRTAVARASDDFYPRDPASSSPHITACAYNSLFLGALVQPDWDMFHSKHQYARLHAMARAVSGGSVYISDRPGEHDFDLLKTLVLSDGSVLRAKLPGRPTRDCMFQDPLRSGKHVLKVWNINSHNALVGVFHVQGSSWDRVRRKFHVHDRAPKPLAGQVCAWDVESFRPGTFYEWQWQQRGPVCPGAETTESFISFRFNQQTMTKVQGQERLEVPLSSGEGELVWFSPLYMLPNQVQFSAVGLTEMMNGGASVVSMTCDVVKHGPGHGRMLGAAAPAGMALIDEAAATASVDQPLGSWDGNGAEDRSVDGHIPVSLPEALSSTQNGTSVVADRSTMVKVQVRGTGRFTLYSSCAPASVWINLAAREFNYDVREGRLEVLVPAAENLLSEMEVWYSS